MRELMAECAYPHKLVGCEVDFVGTRIFVEFHTVEFSPMLRPGISRMRPYRINRSSVGLAVTGIKHIDIIDVAVTVKVEFCEINHIVHKDAGIPYHFLRPYIRASVDRGAIIRHSSWQGHRPQHDRVKFELPERTIGKIIAHTPCSTVIAKPTLTYHPADKVSRILRNEPHIGKFSQYNQCLDFSFSRIVADCQGFLCRNARTGPP